MPKAQRKKLLDRLDKQLRSAMRVFSDDDPYLSKQAYIPLYYLFIKVIERDYASAALYGEIRAFLQEFQTLRAANLEKDEDQRDPVLIEFGRLIQQGTNDLASLEQRVGILRRFFLQSNSHVTVRDARRAFTADERLALFHLAGGRCQNCTHQFKDVDEMEADHQRQWAHGGPTSIANGRALCADCNKRLAAKVK